MIVISDTTPLISLLKINRLDLLEKLFGQVQIPQGVFSELTENPRFQCEANIIKESHFIKVINEIDEKLLNVENASKEAVIKKEKNVYDAKVLLGDYKDLDEADKRIEEESK